MFRSETKGAPFKSTTTTVQRVAARVPQRYNPMATVHPLLYPTPPMSRPLARSSKLRLLLVDEDVGIWSACRELESGLGFVTNTAPALRIARDRLRDEAFDLLLLDLNALPEEGLALLDEIKELHPGVGVIVTSACVSVFSAVDVMHAGVFEYLPKPFSRDELAAVLERCAARAGCRCFSETPCLSRGLTKMICQSPEMEKLLHILSSVAKGSHPVLIMGERGVGKELVARTIHANGLHADRPFVSIDCRSVASSSLASELFALVKQPPAGPDRPKRGFPVTSPGGTIFLDNIGGLSIDLQAKLFQVMRGKDIRFAEVGHQTAVQVRFLTATDHDLAEMVEQGRFRKDLYHSLSVVNLRIPALRDRKQDIPLLATHFLDQMSCRTGTTHTLSIDVLHTLTEYEWPGNIRELEHSIASACVLASGFVLQIDDLPTQLQRFHRLKNRRAPAVLGSLVTSSEPQQGCTCSVPLLPIADLEKQAILSALRSSKGDKVSIARDLGIAKTTLYRKLKKYGVVATRGL